MKIQQLLSGFLSDRDQKTFVLQDKSNRLGWEIRLGDKSYSTFITGKIENWGEAVSKYKRAFQICLNRVNSMKKPNRQVCPTFHPKENSYNGTTGKLNISTEPLEENTLTPNEQLDVMLGITTHEMLHHLFTDYNPKMREWKSKFHHTVFNTLEDERIERISGYNFPGYAFNIMALKHYFFKMKYEAIDWKGDAVSELWDCFFKMVRYPKYLEEILVEKHFENLLLIKDALTPYPKTAVDCKNATDLIYSIFLSLSDKIEDVGPDATGESNNGASADDSQTSNGDDDSQEAQNGESSVAESSQAESVNSESKSQTEGDVVNGSEEAGTPREQLEARLEEIANLLSAAEMQSTVPEEMGDIPQEIIYEAIEGNGEIGLEPNVIIEKAVSDRESYQKAKIEVMGPARVLAKHLTLDLVRGEQKVFGLRHGQLNENRLVDAVIGDPLVYFRKKEKVIKSLTIALLIDESGSMYTRDSYVYARKVAVLFNEAVTRIPKSELFVYGFTSDYKSEGVTEIIPYLEGNKLKDPTTLGSIGYKGSNADGVAINEVVKRVRKQTADPVLFFVISDGQPSASFYHNVSAIDHTRESVTNAEKSGFLPIQIGINVNEYYQSQMFDRYVNYSTPEQMVHEVGMLLRKEVKKFTGRMQVA